jgi:hypothetical protein
VNIPKLLCDDAGFQAKDDADVRYVEGIGIIVSVPIKLPLTLDERKRSPSMNVSRYGRNMRSYDGKYLEVIPLYDGFRRNKGK